VAKKHDLLRQRQHSLIKHTSHQTLDLCCEFTDCFSRLHPISYRKRFTLSKSLE